MKRRVPTRNSNKSLQKRRRDDEEEYKPVIEISDDSSSEEQDSDKDSEPEFDEQSDTSSESGSEYSDSESDDSDEAEEADEADEADEAGKADDDEDEDDDDEEDEDDDDFIVPDDNTFNSRKSYRNKGVDIKLNRGKLSRRAKVVRIKRGINNEPARFINAYVKDDRRDHRRRGSRYDEFNNPNYAGKLFV